ncbi:MAG: DUF4097 family beta strand repeat protein [Cyclobacteriaceae bacterium]|nr:DUF4097 family beta strand repeat protein [Cyclobacteriaceae bacterium SS2]
MRLSIIATLLVITIGGLHAQEIKEIKKHVVKPKGTLSETRLVLTGFRADILIEGTNGSDIEISTSDFEEKPERADGLRSLSDMAMENTSIGLNVEQKGSEIIVMPASRRSQDGEYIFKVPKSVKVKMADNSFLSNDIEVRGMSNEVELNCHSGDIIIDNVTGPIVAKTISGDIEIKFSSLNQKLPSSINTISGDIDITLASSDKGSFSISSISGEVFTDLDLKVKKTGESVTDIDVDIQVDVNGEVQRAMRETERAMKEQERAMKEMEREATKHSANAHPVVAPVPPQVPFHFNWATPSGIGSKFQAELNGGGVNFDISSISGDVYLRKSK